MNLLHVDCSILGTNSVTRQLSAALVERIKGSNASVSVIYRDLAADPLAHLSGMYLAAAAGAPGEHESALQHDLAVSGEVMDEFLNADTIVIGVPMYNFTVPSQLRAWIDRLVVQGKTFRYTETGPEGLAGGKKVVLVIARGGFYGAGAPGASMEHAESYMRAVLGFMGITDIEVVIAEGVSIGAEQRAESLTAATQRIASFSI